MNGTSGFSGRALGITCVEIGTFHTPIPGISPVYVDRFSETANQSTLAEYFCDAADLPFLEWYRVLRNNGVIYMVVPSRLFTCDRLLPLTAVEHIVEDFRNHVTQCDGTHIDDFLLNVDWREFSPSTP